MHEIWLMELPWFSHQSPVKGEMLNQLKREYFEKSNKLRHILYENVTYLFAHVHLTFQLNFVFVHKICKFYSKWLSLPFCSDGYIARIVFILHFVYFDINCLSYSFTILAYKINVFFNWRALLNHALHLYKQNKHSS